MRTRVVAGAAMTAALIAAIGCGSGGKSTTAAAEPGAIGAAHATESKKHGRRANWPTYHGNLARTGVDGTSPPLGQVHRAWSHSLDAALYAEPLVVGSRVYVATENNTVYALNATNGQATFTQQYAPLRDLNFTLVGDYSHQTLSSGLTNAIPSLVHETCCRRCSNTAVRT